MPTPPIQCTPCLVRYEGIVYRISSKGEVIALTQGVSKDGKETWAVDPNSSPLPESLAKPIRREASRLRRNRNARERNQARRDVGMKHTAQGWE